MVNELRSGNYLLFKRDNGDYDLIIFKKITFSGKPIEKVTSWEANYSLSGSATIEKMGLTKWERQVAPILLLPEIFPIIGFKEKLKGDTFDYFSIGDFSVGYMHESKTISIVNYGENVCKFLHQLQNLYNTFTGKEIVVNENRLLKIIPFI